MKIRNTTFAAVVLFASTATFAAISPALQNWGSGPVQFIMTKEEAKEWKGIQTDADAQKFIDLFWARRDPTPDTALNEYKETFEAEVKYADEHFTYRKTAGSMTDRGKILVIFGTPTKVQDHKGGDMDIPESADDAGGSIDDLGGDAAGRSAPSQVWNWAGPAVQSRFGVPKFSLTFRDVGTGDLRLIPPKGFDYPAAAQKAIVAAIKSPTLTEVPKYAAKPAGAPAAVAPSQVPAAPIKMTTQLKNDTYRGAIDQLQSSKTNPYKDTPVFYGEFVTPKGEYFVPVEIDVPAAAGLTATDQTIFFGTVTDSTGKVVASYEEPAPLSMSRSDLYYDKSLILPPGKYTGVFGLAKDGKPVTLTSTELDLGGVDKDAPGVSKLIISNNVYPLSAAQKATDPFAFGGMKVVPKADRTFTKADELWYFVEVRNPGVDATGQPKFQSKVEVEGKDSAGKSVQMQAPLQETPAEPLKGVPGHFAIGSSIPLSGFNPGDYKLKLKLIDTVSKKTYDMEESFKVVGGAK